MSEVRLDQVHDDVEMTFLDHLEALRWHIVRSVASIVVFSIAAFIFKDFIFDEVFMGPKKISFWTYRQLCYLSGKFNLGDSMCVKDIGFSLINTEMAGQFTQHIMVSLAVGVALAFPYAAWEVWRFFKPALLPRERMYARLIVFFSSLLFMIGILFGYYIITPISIQFLGSYSVSKEVVNNITLESYISTITMMTFSAALVFELPMVVYFLSVAGFLTPKIMRTYRKHAVVVILILTAVITPSTDMTSQLVLAIPFVVLYELSILVSQVVLRKRLKREKEEGF